MKVYIAILVLLFITTQSIAQSRIDLKGIILDTTNAPLSRANIQLYNISKDKLIAYTTSSSLGAYKLSEISLLDSLYLKVSYLGYVSQERLLIKNQEDFKKPQNFVLIKSLENLKEVIIKTSQDLVTVKKDTIKYNLSKSLTGKEEKLKDIIDNLPGVKVNENGKITVNGKPINNLLIDGEKFFDNQHRLALDNIEASMIKGVTFFNKFKDFTNFNDNQGSALNIEIKDAFKDKITGTLEALGAVKNRYDVNASIFKLGKKAKITLITDFNNTGNQSINIDDYLSLKESVSARNLSNEGLKITKTPDDDIPEFLRSNDRIEQREIGLGALNYTFKPLNELRISGFLIANETSQFQSQQLSRTFFLSETEDQKEIITNDLKNLFGSFKSKIEYKLNKKSLLTYEVNYSPNRPTNQRVINRTDNLISDSRSVNSYNFGHQLGFKTSMSKKSLLNIKFLQQKDERNNILGIAASNQILDLGESKEPSDLNQSKKINSETVGISTLFSSTVGKLSYKLSGNYFERKEIFRSQLEINDTVEPIFLNMRRYNNINTFFNASYKILPKLTLNAGLTYDIFKFKNANTIHQVLPNLGVGYQLNAKHAFNITYDLSNEFIALKGTVDQRLIEDYLNIIERSSLMNNNLFTKNSLNFVYTNLNLQKGNSLLFYAGYTKQNKSLEVSQITSPEQFTQSTYFINRINESLITALDWEYTIPNTNYIFKSQSAIFSIVRENAVENNRNISKINDYKQDLSLEKRSKKFLNYKFGARWNLQQFKNSFNASNVTSSSTVLYLNVLAGKQSDLFFSEFTTSYNYYNTSDNQSRSFIGIDPKISFSPKNEKFDLYLKGENILNIKSPEIIENYGNSNFFEQRVSNSLAGYLGLGIKWSF